MEIKFTAVTMEKPKELSLRQSLAWDYLGINNGGWVAAETGDGGIVVSDESCDLGNGFTHYGFDSFCEWLDDTATDAIKDSPLDFLRSATGLSDALLTSEVVNAMLSALSAGEKSQVPVEFTPEPAASPMQDYYVTFAIDGRNTFKVEASDVESAKREAECDFQAADYREYLEFVDAKIISVEDEQGNIVYDR